MKPAVFMLFIAVLFSALPASAAEAWRPEQALGSFIRSSYPWKEIEVTDVRMNGVPPREAPRKILPDGGRLPGRASFIFEFPGAIRLRATASVKAYDTVVMSRGAFSKGSLLKRGDLYERLLDVTRIPRDTIRDFAAILGKPLTRAILPNMPLTENMVSQSPALKAGTKVVLLLEGPGFAVRGLGELKQNGYPGEYVKVLNPSSKKVVTGFLTDEHTVKVEY